MSEAHALDRRSLWWSVAATTACLLPLARFVPVWLTALIGALLAIGLSLRLTRRALPMPLRLLLTIGIAGVILWDYGVVFGARFGRDTGTALLAAMLALKTLELRRLRDARLIVSFGLFALMAGFLQDQGPLTLILALLGTLTAIAALAQLADAEVPGTPTPIAWPVRLLAAARFAAYAVPLAIAAFFLFPRLGSPLWGLPGNSQEARTGLSDTMSPGDIARLYSDDSPMLRARFDGPPPGNAELYWRGPVLSVFDGRRWTRATHVYGHPEVLEPLAEPLAYSVQQEPTERRWIFALDLPVAAPGDARLTIERSTVAARPLNEVALFRLQSTPSYRLAPALSPAERAHHTALPDAYNPRAREQALRWRAEVGRDDRAFVQRALAWFNRDFSYTLAPELLGRHSADEFLFETQAGYCEHFASAFAILMRSGDLPTRVVTGYQGGVTNEVGDYLLVRQSDAHAWNEVWLAGEGWVRVDPTSAVAPHRIERGLDALPGRQRTSAWSKPLFDTADWLRRAWNDFVLGYDADRQRLLLQPFGLDRSDWRHLGLALAVGVGLALAATMLLLLRRLPYGEDPLGRAWRQFLRRLARAGLAKQRAEGPLAFAARAAARWPAEADRILALSRRYAAHRYAANIPDREERRRLVEALRRFRIARSARR